MQNKAVKNVIAVIGPTSSGKSDFAVDLALQIDGEIISADSRQIYKGLDIGTGKITINEMRSVKHYMLDILSLGEPFSVVEYVERVLPIIEDIFARGKTPILCGGTGQYVHATLYDVQFPKVLTNQRLREELQEKSERELFALLLEKDRRRAETIDKHNKVRLIRALEILEENESVPKQENPKPRFPFTIYFMNPSRELLRERIAKRLDKRFEEGMLQEVEQLLKHGSTHLWLHKLGLEYRYVSLFLEGKMSFEEMKEKLYFKICQYAKRQMTWNKKYFPDAEMIDVK